ncbi:Putative peptidoglycan binding domain-containing protein [Shimia gijangensis]|uniref:Putative peptidoglycan binding domain-containing protein n=1 Tax=Shimia gijangensis TaxID=1470563 RepID=A0A1M6BMZ0_9RHOB|nr:peptidoglycan-binding domain-containing protein [Shimia gijangensis]SHI49873.1 Putative peptidoglycan binding domain-containing protein [Shimia gijangensis]
MRLSVFAIALVSAGAAQAEIEDCYALESPQDKIGEMVVTSDGDMTYTQKGQPNILYFSGCGVAENDVVKCSIECDGGNMSYTHSVEGIEVDASGFRIETMQFDSILNGAGRDGADGEVLYGVFLLKPAPVEMCRKVNARMPDIILQAGDVHPFVAGLERNLLAGGYFVGGADTVFDTRTTDAVKAYQADVGLEQTGHADRALMRRLGVDTMLAFGGC